MEILRDRQCLATSQKTQRKQLFTSTQIVLMSMNVDWEFMIVILTPIASIHMDLISKKNKNLELIAMLNSNLIFYFFLLILSCQCMKGYIGDGKKKCDKTCNETCINGICSNYPDYTCLCDLGWTGSDCSVNCGCNNHSTCRNGTKLCDECKDNTEGKFCERCKIGSYGDATSTRCISCNCNEHGDESRGLCDQKSGKCFCLDNTEGENCENCANEFYGNPRNGGRCYSQCQSRGILKMTNGKSQGIGSFQSQSDVTECLWLLKLNQTLIEGGFIRFEVSEEMNVSCNSNAIYVYNSISELNEQKKLLNVICREENFFDNFRESRSGEIAIYFHRNAKNEGFNGIVSIFSCQLGTCRSPFTCDKTSNCVCPNGTRGLNCEIEICRENCTNGVCDTKSNKCICNETFGGEDCSLPIKPTSIVAQELFSTLTVTKNLNHLKKTLPRFGHTVNADRRGYLWIFGGYSISNGALNDIRQFDTKNHTWMQVTVDGSDTKMPTGRYFHAAEITKHSIYVYGGIGNDYKVLSDFWMFNIQEQRWSEVEISSTESPGALAGHTMTIVKVDENERLLIIGGYKNISKTDTKSSEIPLISHHNHQIVWEFDFDEKSWKKLNTSGSSPAVIFGHTTSYHLPKHLLYIFGGYQFANGNIEMTNRLYSLSRTKDGMWTWNFLPIFNELNRAEENLPRARFLHSAIAFQNYLLIYSG
jgi:multipile epidermal growth factor-like domains protein 8